MLCRVHTTWTPHFTCLAYFSLYNSFYFLKNNIFYQYIAELRKWGLEVYRSLPRSVVKMKSQKTKQLLVKVSPIRS